VTIQDELSEESFNTETDGSRVVCTVKEIVFVLGELLAEEKRGEITASCEGYYYSFRVVFPNRIQQAWWTNLENEKMIISTPEV